MGLRRLRGHHDAGDPREAARLVPVARRRPERRDAGRGRGALRPRRSRRSSPSTATSPSSPTATSCARSARAGSRSPWRFGGRLFLSTGSLSVLGFERESARRTPLERDIGHTAAPRHAASLARMQPVRRLSPLLLMLAIAALLGVAVVAPARPTPIAQSDDPCAAMANVEHPVRAGERPPDRRRRREGLAHGLAAHHAASWRRCSTSSGRTLVGGPANDELLGHHGSTRSVGAGGQGRPLGRLGPAQQQLRPARRPARRRGQRLHLPQPRDDDRRRRPRERHDPGVLRPGHDRLRPRHARPRPDPRERRVQDAQLRADPALLPVRIEAERRLQAARRDARGAGGALSAASRLGRGVGGAMRGSRRPTRRLRTDAPRGKGRRRRGVRPVARGLTPGPRPARPAPAAHPAAPGTSTTLPAIPPDSAKRSAAPASVRGNVRATCAVIAPSARSRSTAVRSSRRSAR